MASFFRIWVVLWADLFAMYAMFAMMTYLTEVWKLSFTHAAGILNIWGGITRLLPIFLVFLVDSLLGHYLMLLLSSFAFTAGLGLLSLSTPPVLANSTGTCKNYEPECVGPTQKAVFYTSLALIAIGLSGHRVSLESFVEEQRMNDSRAEGKDVVKLAFAICAIVLIPITGGIALPYIKPWSIRFGIPAIMSIVALFLFLTGTQTYTKNTPRQGIVTWGATTQSKMIFLLRVIPISTTFVICGTVSSIGNTYFVEQANHMDRYIGKLQLPLPILLTLYEWAKLVFQQSYSCLEKHLKTSRKEKYVHPIAIALAMTFSILCCVVSAGVEIWRLRVIRSHDLIDKPEEEIPLSLFVLLPQFILLAGLDLYMEKGIIGFFDHQVSRSMKTYVDYFLYGVSGMGFIGSVVSVYVAGKASERVEGANWFQYTLNRSRLDRYYWVLAVLSFLNLLYYIIIVLAVRYTRN